MTDRFLDYITYEKRYAQHTITAYRSDLEQFSTYTRQEFGIDNINKVDHQVIRSWVVSLMEQKAQPRSVNRKITTLKSYFKFLVKEGVIEENPATRVISPKVSVRLPVYVEESNMENLFERVEFGTDYPGLRDRLIMELFYLTGMRLSELIHLREQDIDLASGAMKVTGKRNKQRIIPFNGKMGAMISDYLEHRRSSFPVSGREDWLLLTNKGKKLYPRMVYRLVQHYLSQVTTITRRSPHVIRHTFATHMLNHGADLNAIKEILGHANLAATQVYTHNTIEKLKSIYQSAHPRA
jgi:integrase/recombinase XerC